MASLDQQPPMSPAFNYHNRFAEQSQTKSADAHTNDNNKNADTTDSKEDDFGFSFEDVKPLSFSQQYNSSSSAADQTSQAPVVAEHRQDRDVAALEALVARDEQEAEESDGHQQAVDQATIASKSSSGPPPLPLGLRQNQVDQEPRSSLSLEGNNTGPQESSDDARPSSASNPPAGRSSWYTAAPGDRSSVDPAPASVLSPATSNKSLAQSSLKNFSRPQQQDGPAQHTSDAQHSDIASRLGSLDVAGEKRPSAETSGPTVASSFGGPSQPYNAQAPQYRTVPVQQAALVSPDQHRYPQVESAQPESFHSVSGASVPSQHQNGERPNSFFGLDKPIAAAPTSAAETDRSTSGEYNGNKPGMDSADDSGSAFFPRSREESNPQAVRPSSFFGVQADSLPSGNNGPSQAERIAAQHRAETQRQASSAASSNPGQTRSTLAGGTGNAYIQQTNSMSGGRPASIAPSTSGPLLDHSHLKPGQQAALLSHHKTLELYRQNAKKTNDPDLIYELAVFMIDASKSMAEGAPAPTGATGAAALSTKDEIIKEAIGLLKKIAERGHPDAQYFLADCYANGIGSPKNKQDFDRAYPLFVLAAKHGHPDAAYRAGTCCEKGWGCRRDAGKALQFYRKASSQSHPGSMYRLATAELNGELGLKRSAKEGVKWLKRSAENATPEFPHALHELALLHERGIDNVLFVDPEYSCELLAQAGEMGYAPSAYKLGVNYEYGRMGCPQDAGLSIHMYNIAAQQNHKEACFALTAWYLVGAPGILPQSDTEAFLWAKKAAEQGLAKAEYAVGYFTEMGIGTVKDLKEAKAWFTRAAEHGDKRANQRLAALGARTVPQLTGVGAGTNAGKDNNKGVPKAGQHGESATGTDYASMPQARRTQPTNAPFPSRVEVSLMTPAASAGATTYPSPLTMRDAQSAQREERYLANVAAHQQAQIRAASINAASNLSSPISPMNSSSQVNAFGALGQGFGGPQQPSLQPSQAPAPIISQPRPPHSKPGTPPVRPGSGGHSSPNPPQAAPGQQRQPQPGGPRPPWSPQSNGHNGPYTSAANYPSYPSGMSSPPPGHMTSPPRSPSMASGPYQGMNGFQGPPNGQQPQRPPPNGFPLGQMSGSGNSQPPMSSQNGQMSAMQARMQSDDAAANQIAQRLAQQQGQGQQPSPTAQDQPKKKKGWFK
ncbi:unnamed protein product [Sympodiomycopsis kandeliae]